MSFMNVLAKISAVYNLFLMIAALILNPLVLFVCIKSNRLRSHSTFKLLAFNSVNDLLVCLAWNWECFTNTFFDLLEPWRSLFYCEWISTFIEFSTLEFTSWMLVSISLERLLSMSIKKWSKHYFAGVRPYVYSTILVIGILVLNFNEVFYSGYSIVVNGTEEIFCFENPPGQFPTFHTMAQVSFFV